MAACVAGSRHRSPSATISSADLMSSSRQLPHETEDPFSLFPSEDDASSPQAKGLFAANEDSFAVFPSEDEGEMACRDENQEGPAEVALISNLPASRWRPAVVSLARTCAKSVSASRVYWWPLLIAAAGMFAVERASVRWPSLAPKSAAISQAVASLQGPRVPAPLPGVPINPAAVATTMVPSVTDTRGRAANVPRPAEVLAPTGSVSLSTITRTPLAPIISAQPLEAGKGNRNDVAPEAVNALRSAATETPLLVEAHLPESPPPAPLAEETPVPVASLATAPVAVDAAANDLAAIDRVLGTYQQSYSSLDAGMVSTIWRGLDTRGLQRAFNGLDSQRMSFEHCDVRVGGDRAKVSCTGVLDYVRKIGQPTPLQKRLSWNFDLQRTGDRWLISGVDAR
jgi:hypothetical protein